MSSRTLPSSATEIAAQIRRGELSPVTAVEECLERIHEQGFATYMLRHMWPSVRERTLEFHGTSSVATDDINRAVHGAEDVILARWNLSVPVTHNS
jgi:Asp-tRNA(Asn)/Glu-tRNA(Gln) amidotransferase A subunit family amidase